MTTPAITVTKEGDEWVARLVEQPAKCYVTGVWSRTSAEDAARGLLAIISGERGAFWRTTLSAANPIQQEFNLRTA